MILILSDLYCTSAKPNRFILANFPFKALLARGELHEDEYGSLRHTQQLMQVNENMGGKCLMSRHKLLELTSKEGLERIIAEGSTEDDSVEIAKMFSTRMMVARGSGQSNICFMDMRGEKVLSPEDSKQFEFLIFGGILGDHPPQDRAKDLRENFANVRQLGTVQMTTDTALMVAREILEEGKPISSLKFVENPEIPTDDSVKRYLDMAFPIATLASDKFKGQSLVALRSDENIKKDVAEFERYCRT